MNRPRNVALALSFAVCFGMLAAFAIAQGPPPEPFSVQNIKDRVYWTRGGGGANTGFIVGQDGVIVFDSKMTPDGTKKVLEAIAKYSPYPITDIILSHSDADHVNGLSGFAAGRIIAQENCKREMEASKGTPMAAPQDRLPTQTFDKELDLTLDGVRVQLRHWVPAHTSGDTVMVLPDEGIVFGGDLIDLTQFAYVHPLKGGSTEGWITSMKGILAIDADTFVSGHGDLQTKETLKARLAAVEARREKIKEMVAAGKSLDEIKKTAGPEEPPYGPYKSPGFTEVVYQELTKKG
jgi:cyclase